MTTVLVGSRDRAMIWRQDHPEVDTRDMILADRYESVAGLNLRADSEVVRLGGLSSDVEAGIEFTLGLALRV